MRAVREDSLSRVCGEQSGGAEEVSELCGENTKEMGWWSWVGLMAMFDLISAGIGGVVLNY